MITVGKAVAVKTATQPLTIICKIIYTAQSITGSTYVLSVTIEVHV